MSYQNTDEHRAYMRAYMKAWIKTPAGQAYYERYNANRRLHPKVEQPTVTTAAPAPIPIDPPTCKFCHAPLPKNCQLHDYCCREHMRKEFQRTYVKEMK